MTDDPKSQFTVTSFETENPDFPKPDPFEGPKLKIERAKRHIADYRVAFKAFTESNIVRIEPDIDPETGSMMLKVWLAQPLPGDMRITAADALYNLRSALDQAACCCARLAGESPKGTYFPHGQNKARFEVSLGEKCQKVPAPIRDAIAKLEPYYGGDGYLFRVLHDLNIVDKHSELITVLPALRSISISTGKPLPTGKVWHRGEDKFELAPPDMSGDYQNAKVTMIITFTEIEAIKGEPVLQVLPQLCDLVERTVGILESEMAAYLAATR